MEKTMVAQVIEAFDALKRAVLRALGSTARAIKDVESWDGSAANYDTAEAYAKACLINLNTGDAADWTKDKCKLPVREPGDSAETYVKQAVHAAAAALAGGRGGLKKPDGVSDDDWDAALKKAANELLGVYAEMEEDAPDALYEAAEKKPPKRSRTLDMGQIWSALNVKYPWVSNSTENVDVRSTYIDGTMIYAIAIQNGKLYKISISDDGKTIAVGDLVEVEPDFKPTGEETTNPRAKRETSLHWIMERLWNALDAMNKEALITNAVGEVVGIDETKYTGVVDVFKDGDKLYLVAGRAGKLYRAEILIDAATNAVTLGEFTPLGTTTREFKVIRAADGTHRWVMIAATNVLNKDAEIDSAELFDSFIVNARATGNYPVLDFWHQGERVRLGVADFLARDEHLYISAGVFDDNDVGRAAAAGIVSKPAYWGNSIEYKPTQPPEMVEVAENVRVPVYRAGVNTFISIVPKHRACNYFTATDVAREVVMDKKIFESLQQLLGAEVAEQFRALADNTNRAITESGAITRTAGASSPAKPAAPATSNQPADPPVPDQTRELVLDEKSLEALVTAVFNGDQFKAFATQLAEMATALGALKTASETGVQETRTTLGKVEGRLDLLERLDDDKRRQWQADLPKPKPVNVTFRPSAQTPVKPDAGSTELANATLEKMKTRN